MKYRFATILAAGLALCGPAQAGATFDAIKARGQLVCGVSEGTPGITMPNQKGEWTGLYVDLCRAVAAALVGDAAKVKFVPHSTVQRFVALQSGEVDMVARTATATALREAQLGLRFAPVGFYDGQAVMVQKSSGITSVKAMDGATICVQPGSTSELNLADYFRGLKLSFKPVTVESLPALEAAYLAGRCDAVSNDASVLAGLKLGTARPDDHVILPERLSKEPTALVVRKGDDELFDLVRWAMFALIEAEELGVTKANAEEQLKSTNPPVRRLLGTEPGVGAALKVDDRWAWRMIAQLGNYGEIFERNLGQQSEHKLPRGLNDLWTRGGLMYAWPVR